MHLDRTEIPPGNIKHRWTRSAGPQLATCSTLDITDQVASKIEAVKRRALQLAQGSDPIDDQTFTETLHCMDNMLRLQVSTSSQLIETCNHTESIQSIQDKQHVPLSCPPRPTRTGRPRDTSLKSWKKHEKSSKQSKGAHHNVTQGIKGEDGTPCAKTRRLCDLLEVTL